MNRNVMRWLGSRSHLDLITYGGHGHRYKMDFVDVVLCMYGCMYAVSTRPRLTLL